MGKLKVGKSEFKTIFNGVCICVHYIPKNDITIKQGNSCCESGWCWQLMKRVWDTNPVPNILHLRMGLHEGPTFRMSLTCQQLIHINHINDNVHLRFDDSALFSRLDVSKPWLQLLQSPNTRHPSWVASPNHPKIPRFRELFDLLKKACHIGHISCDINFTDGFFWVGYFSIDFRPLPPRRPQKPPLIPRSSKRLCCVKGGKSAVMKGGPYICQLEKNWQQKSLSSFWKSMRIGSKES